MQEVAMVQAMVDKKKMNKMLRESKTNSTAKAEIIGSLFFDLL